jgi:hypothetical protein
MGSYYFGIRASDGRLVAMAGERLQSTAFVEISAVCTHPEFRGRGYARDLTTFLAAQILAVGKTPFLHVKSENGAKVVYRNIGFRFRAAICLTVISSAEDVVSCERYRRVAPQKQGISDATHSQLHAEPADHFKKNWRRQCNNESMLTEKARKPSRASPARFSTCPFSGRRNSQA